MTMLAILTLGLFALCVFAIEVASCIAVQTLFAKDLPILAWIVVSIWALAHASLALAIFGAAAKVDEQVKACQKTN